MSGYTPVTVSTGMYRGYVTFLSGEDGRYRASVGGKSIFSTRTLKELHTAIDRSYASLPDSPRRVRAALAKAGL